jgi:predicted kinase
MQNARDPSAAPTLHFLCGKAGAGKSTIAARLAAGQHAILICEDVWLARLFGDRMHTFDDYRQLAQRLKTVVGPLAVDLLHAGCSVVLDYPANTRAARAWMRSLYEQAGASHVLHYVATSDPTCLARIGQRNGEKPEGSHQLSEEDFAHISSFFEAPDVAEGFNIQVHGERGDAADPAG